MKYTCEKAINEETQETAYQNEQWQNRSSKYCKFSLFVVVLPLGLNVSHYFRN